MSWTPEMDDKLRELCAESPPLPWTDIGRELGRAASVTSWRAERLGLTKGNSNRHRTNGWSPAMDKLATELWEAGVSALEISRHPEMDSKSRSAVLGRLFRLGVMGQARAAPKQPAGVRAPARPQWHSYSPKSHAARRSPVAAARVAGPMVCAPIYDLALARPVLEASRSLCQWPVAEDPDVVGGFLFCQATRAHGAYCAGHGAIAYTGRWRPADEVAA